MAKVFDTANLTEGLMRKLSPDEASWIYNGLDCCVTGEVYKELKSQLDSEPEYVQATYAMALAKLAPIMEMSLRGTKVNERQRQQSIRELSEDLNRIDGYFQRIMQEIFGAPVNWRSPTQLKHLFYKQLKVKEVKKRNARGQYTATVNREALESFQMYFYARPLAAMILVMRDLHKQVSFLKTGLDPDHRIRTSYNIAGTNTGRLASAMSDFGTGTNLQNVNRKLRFPFVADTGKIMVNIDLEQADARNVGAICWNLFYESHGPEFAGAYLDACESGDLHTVVCNMTWPELDWPEDPAEWKSFCDGFYLHGQDSPRQLAKKLGHGTNYYGTPRTMAKHAHTARHVIEDFQFRYFRKFPCIPAWHKAIIQQIVDTGTLVSLYGRRRMFFGRANDAATHRKAIAYDPQSSTGEEIDRGLLQIWRKFPEVELLNQVHDSILFQIPVETVNDMVEPIMETMKVTLPLAGGRLFTVPLDAKVGFNWGDYDETNNPYGLKKWRGEETRVLPAPKTRLKDYL